jgi:hypothetical protein
VPLILVLALVFGHARSHKATPSGTPTAALGPVTIQAPPANPAAETPCTAVIGHLPLALAGMAARPARSSWAFVVAWGDPAVELVCGVPRPAGLTPGSSAQTIGVDGVFWLPVQRKNDTVWTTIDRAAYVQVTVPRSYPQPPLAPIADAIAKALPAVCVVDPNEADVTKLCTHRP